VIAGCFCAKRDKGGARKEYIMQNRTGKKRLDRECKTRQGDTKQNKTKRDNTTQLERRATQHKRTHGNTIHHMRRLGKARQVKSREDETFHRQSNINNIT
jgi:hypothetical protein